MFLSRQKRSQKTKSAKKEIFCFGARASDFAQDGDSLSATTIPNAADA
jgi:hypothetical protein